MSEFREKEYVPNELIRKCGFETDARSTNGLDWQELLDRSRHEIENYKGALNLIRVAEIEVIKSQKRLTQEISKNSVFGLKNTSECLASETRKRYGLLQLRDILNKDNVGVSTLYHSCFRSDSFNIPSTDSLNTTIVESEIWTGDEEVLQIASIESSVTTETTETTEYETSSNEIISSAYFECGKCFIGELVIIPTTMKNFGESGRFFIITEVDWSSMNIEDITNSNMVLTPPFAVYPAYFLLRTNEEITLYSYFFPTTYGMQVDKFCIISDNCSVQPLEIIGDGIMFEEKFIVFNEKSNTRFEYHICEDEFAKYCIELDSRNSDQIFQNMIEILNTSGMVLYYRWEQRNVKSEENKERKWEDLSLDDIIIDPKSGIFEPYSTSKFYIFAETKNLVSDQYRTILQLCIEDIPLASIHKKNNLQLQDSKSHRIRLSLGKEWRFWTTWKQRKEMRV
ncbi:uncharacterized protein LOC117178460 [Belonocnema kinseyi]|uniref:uncharacterized protein LOC117178460 n=1 Tax=Belonocnema kinseyi TaxID=2817044 RepID=UPI00143D3EC7|nr:uncharacterized protein LOC117178460 [Belonocnema kinseyi]